MSPPCAPALLTTAPPTVPGTLTAHSKPLSPCAAHLRASTVSAMPAVTVTAVLVEGRFAHPVDHDQPAKPGIADQHVRAAAEHAHRDAFLPRRADDLDQLSRSNSRAM